MMKRITFWALSTITALVLLFGYHTSTSGASVSAPTSIDSAAAGSGSGDGSGSSTTGGSGSDASAGDGSADGVTPTDTSSPTPSAAGSDAGSQTVTGDSVDTRWGPVQVAITVSGGTITDVSVPVYPQTNHRDVEINAYALPVLIDETMSAQNANIDMVSGATVTSVGYLKSLQSALDEAGL